MNSDVFRERSIRAMTAFVHNRPHIPSMPLYDFLANLGETVKEISLSERPDKRLTDSMVFHAHCRVAAR